MRLPFSITSPLVISIVLIFGIITLQIHNPKKWKQIFPEKELSSLSPNFDIHLPVNDLFISTIGLPILLQENMWTDPENIKKKNLADT
jgi:hypothetical protein